MLALAHQPSYSIRNPAAIWFLKTIIRSAITANDAHLREFNTVYDVLYRVANKRGYEHQVLQMYFIIVLYLQASEYLIMWLSSK